jgi:predicted nucleic acid-binding protein
MDRSLFLLRLLMNEAGFRVSRQLYAEVLEVAGKDE